MLETTASTDGDRAALGAATPGVADPVSFPYVLHGFYLLTPSAARRHDHDLQGLFEEVKACFIVEKDVVFVGFRSFPKIFQTSEFYAHKAGILL